MGYLSFGPAPWCHGHACTRRPGLRARVAQASSRPSPAPCKQCSALTSPGLHARGCASPSCARGHRKHTIFFQWVQNLGTPRYTCARCQFFLCALSFPRNRIIIMFKLQNNPQKCWQHSQPRLILQYAYVSVKLQGLASPFARDLQGTPFPKANRVRRSVAIYSQLSLFCDQSMREKAWRSRKRGA